MDSISYRFLVFHLLILPGVLSFCGFRTTSFENFETLTKTCSLVDDLSLNLLCQKSGANCSPQCADSLDSGSYWVGGVVTRTTVVYKGCYSSTSIKYRKQAEFELSDNSPYACARACLKNDENTSRLLLKEKQCICVQKSFVSGSPSPSCGTECPGLGTRKCGGDGDFYSFYYIEPTPANSKLIPGESCASLEDERITYHDCSVAKPAVCAKSGKTVQDNSWTLASDECEQDNDVIQSLVLDGSKDHWIAMTKFDLIQWQTTDIQSKDQCVVMTCTSDACVLESRSCNEVHFGLCKEKPTPPPPPVVQTTPKPKPPLEIVSPVNVVITTPQPPTARPTSQTGTGDGEQTHGSTDGVRGDHEDAGYHVTKSEEKDKGTPPGDNIVSDSVQEQSSTTKQAGGTDMLVYILPAVLAVIVIVVVAFIIVKKRRSRHKENESTTDKPNKGVENGNPDKTLPRNSDADEMAADDKKALLEVVDEQGQGKSDGPTEKDPLMRPKLQEPPSDDSILRQTIASGTYETVRDLGQKRMSDTQTDAEHAHKEDATVAQCEENTQNDNDEKTTYDKLGDVSKDLGERGSSLYDKMPRSSSVEYNQLGDKGSGDRTSTEYDKMPEQKPEGEGGGGKGEFPEYDSADSILKEWGMHDTSTDKS